MNEPEPGFDDAVRDALAAGAAGSLPYLTDADLDLLVASACCELALRCGWSPLDVLVAIGGRTSVPSDGWRTAEFTRHWLDVRAASPVGQALVYKTSDDGGGRPSAAAHSVPMMPIHEEGTP